VNDDKPRVTSLSVLLSALAGLIGIQSRKNQERDFNSGKFWHFFIAGAIVTVLFIFFVLMAVKFAMQGT
jgi:hypothetical protein